MDNFRTSFVSHLRTAFLRGVVVIIPLVLTYWVFSGLLNAIDGVFSPVLETYLGREVPGLGFLTMVVLIFLVGILTRNVFGDKSKTFREVVMVEYPRPGLYCIGFVTNKVPYRRTADGLTEFVSVYFPNPPNPTSGFLIFVPRDQAVTLAITVEEGLKLVLSGGIVLPENFTELRAQT
ncbi:MAG: transrane protein [Bacteroidetes bacterium]|nr:transrane protein [Bacteroidota bacterium]